MTMNLTIDMPTACNNNGPLPYLFGNREDHVNLVVPLYEASITGDWETAKRIFEKRPDLKRCGLDVKLGTALHVAVASRLCEEKSNFVKNLIDTMTNEELELKNKDFNTAFWIAAASKNKPAVTIMNEKNSSLMNIRGSNGVLPTTISARSQDWELGKELYNCSEQMTGEHWTDDDRDLTLLYSLESDNHGLALQILEARPELARKHASLLDVLARNSYAFEKEEKYLTSRIIAAIVRLCCLKVQPTPEEDSKALEILKTIWGHATRTMTIGEIEVMLKGPPSPLNCGTIQYSSRILFVAAEAGNTKFIVELLRTYPHLMLTKNDDGLTIFHIAVLHRHHEIYSLLYEIDYQSTIEIFMIKDKSNNNMLHLVGKSSKHMASKATEASLRMQREVLWYLFVLFMVPLYMADLKNDDGQTPYELFSKENEEFISKGLKWMKDCMVVTTLIITIAFAVAFTVPGGNQEGGNQEQGLPIFIHQPAFLVFVIADAVSLFSSSTSLLVFLFILISHHDESDFLRSLPKLVMIGLLSLFISLAAMMVTFSASFFVLYHHGLKWVPILIAAFATLPVFTFAILLAPLWVDMFRSTYDVNYLFNTKKRVLHPTKPRYEGNDDKSGNYMLRLVGKSSKEWLLRHLEHLC